MRLLYYDLYNFDMDFRAQETYKHLLSQLSYYNIKIELWECVREGKIRNLEEIWYNRDK